MKGMHKLHILSVEMWIRWPKMNKIAHISVRNNRKIDFTKNLRLFHFSIFPSKIFRIGVKLPQDLIH